MMSWMIKRRTRAIRGMEAYGRKSRTIAPILMFAWAVVGTLVSSAMSADPTCDCPPTRPVQPHVRAGCPRSIGWWAQPSNNNHYGGYYVGGSAQLHGATRCPNEGVWGWDYLGALFTKRVWLGWQHGHTHHEGEPAYQTEGPKIISHE